MLVSGLITAFGRRLQLECLQVIDKTVDEGYI